VRPQNNDNAQWDDQQGQGFGGGTGPDPPPGNFGQFGGGQGAVPQMPRMAPGASLQDDIRSMVNAMGQCFGYLAQNAAQGQGGGQRSAADAGYRGLKPKRDLVAITVAGPKELMVEIHQLEFDLGEIGISVNSEAGYRRLKAQAQGKARSVSDLALVSEPGWTMKMQLDYANTNYVPVAQRFDGRNVREFRLLF